MNKSQTRRVVNTGNKKIIQDQECPLLKPFDKIHYNAINIFVVSFFQNYGTKEKNTFWFQQLNKIGFRNLRDLKSLPTVAF